MSGVTGNSQKYVQGFPVSGIQNRNGVVEISKSERRKKGRKMDWNDCMNERRKLPNYLASIYHTEDS
jgi:hypothetical protein